MNNEDADLNRFHDDGNPNHFNDLNDEDKRLQDEIDEFEANEYDFWPDYSDGLY